MLSWLPIKAEVCAPFDNAVIQVFLSNLKHPVVLHFEFVVGLWSASLHSFEFCIQMRKAGLGHGKKLKKVRACQRESAEANAKSVHICQFPKTDTLSGFTL